MKLYNGILRPGKIISVLEPGVVRVAAPGLFSEEDGDKLPPVYPFFNIMGAHKNSYSEPRVGDEVWVMNFSDNPMQLYWFRKDKYKDNNIISDTNVEVICNRTCENGSATIYFSDGSGWVISSSGASINITKEGNIILNSNHGVIVDVNDGISLGSKDKSSHTACYADECMSVLSSITNLLSIIEKTANGSPYTKHIGLAMKGKPDNIKSSIPRIESHLVTLE